MCHIVYRHTISRIDDHSWFCSHGWTKHHEKRRKRRRKKWKQNWRNIISELFLLWIRHEQNYSFQFFHLQHCSIQWNFICALCYVHTKLKINIQRFRSFWPKAHQNRIADKLRKMCTKMRIHAYDGICVYSISFSSTLALMSQKSREKKVPTKLLIFINFGVLFS